MTEQQASGEQTSNEEQSQADLQQGADQQQESRQTQDSQESREITDLPNWAQKIIRDERKESAKYRGKVKEYEDASKTEAEKREQALKDAEDRATAAEQRARNALGRVAAMDAASKAGAISSKAVYASIRDDIEFDDESGEPTNIDALIEKYRAEDPALFRTPSADGGKSGPATRYEPSPGVARIAHAYEQNEKAAKR